MNSENRERETAEVVWEGDSPEVIPRVMLVLGNLLKCIGGAPKDAVVHMFALQVVFAPGTGEVKQAAIMDFLKNAIGVGELALGRDLVDEAEFVAGMSRSPHAACGSDQSTIRRSNGSCQHDGY